MNVLNVRFSLFVLRSAKCKEFGCILMYVLNSSLKVINTNFRVYTSLLCKHFDPICFFLLLEEEEDTVSISCTGYRVSRVEYK